MFAGYDRGDIPDTNQSGEGPKIVKKRLSNRTIIFVANELDNFLHHRKHLIELAETSTMRPIVLATPTGDAAVGNLDYRPIKIERFRFDLIRDFSLFLRVFRLLLTECPKVIHLINIKPYLYGGLATRLARLFGWSGTAVVTVPGLGRLYDTMIHPPLLKRFQRAVAEFFLRIAMRGAQVTFETKHDRDFWVSRRLIDFSQSVVTVGAGIDLEHFHAERPKPAPQARFKALFAGRLLKSKGLDVFLKAAEKLKGSEIDMLIAGIPDNDPDAVSLEDLHNKDANIHFLGQINDMAPLLRAVDCVVLPSRYSEGIPRILIEAAACGCVPVATRFPGSQALIEHGKTGFFLNDAKDHEAQAEELALFIRRYKDDKALCRVIGDRAASSVQDNGFSKQSVSAVFSLLYEKP